MSMLPPPPPPPSAAMLDTSVDHLLVSKYFQIASFVMLVYDHMITFDEEVERVWKQRISGASVLFFLNRYITPLQFIIITDAFQDPRWSHETCSKFVLFEGSTTIGMIAICEMIMILRVYALYERSTPILTFLMFCLVFQVFISGYGLHSTFAAPLPPFLVGCILSGSNKISPALWVAPLITDTFIFVLTMWRTRYYALGSGLFPTLRVFFRDGALYFLVIFLANLMNTLLFFTAPADLKAIGATFSQLITATMISRLFLDLRSVPMQSTSQTMNDSYSRGTVGKSERFMTRTIGNLGAAFDSSSFGSGPSEDPGRISYGDEGGPDNGLALKTILVEVSTRYEDRSVVRLGPRSPA